MSGLIEIIKENNSDFIWCGLDNPIKITYKLRLEQMKPVELAELDDADLDEDHERLHQYYQEWLAGEHREQEEGDWSFGDLFKAHIFVVDELKSRGKKCEFDDKLAKGVKKRLVERIKEATESFVWEEGELLVFIVKEDIEQLSKEANDAMDNRQPTKTG